MSYKNESVRSYEQAVEVLNGRESKVIGLNTRIHRNEDDSIGITLHSTELVRFSPDNKTVTVTTGGWNTVTTRERLNRYLPGGLRVFTSKGTAYVANGNWEDKRLFVDDTVIVDGNIDAFPKPEGTDKRVSALKRKVSKYVNAYIDAFKAGEVEKPGARDCFYCQMRVTAPEKDAGKTLGEASGSDHIDEHMKENYFVPSLLTRAIEQFPISHVANQCIASFWDENAPASAREDVTKAGSWYGDIGWRQIAKSLRRYILRQYNIDGR